MAKKTNSRSYKRRSTKNSNKHNALLYIFFLLLVPLTIYVLNIRRKSDVAGVKTEEVIKQHNPFLEESGPMNGSSSDKWWLNSGGRVFIEENSIKTIQGELPTNDRWRKEFAASNPVDTDDGYHPQNIFRLVTKDKWQNFTQQVYFKINKDNLSKSPNRGAWSGVFLFNRYQDGNNLYYTGIRDDGAVVIKKKIRGVYYTLAYKKIFPGIYNRADSPNLIPHDEWIGLKSEVVDTPGGAVSINLFMDSAGGGWMPVIEATDSGRVIKSAGHGGIRTDFMDVEFKEYSFGELDV